MIGKLFKIGLMLWAYALFASYVKGHDGPLLASSSEPAGSEPPAG